MKKTITATWLLSFVVACQANGMVHATLEPSTNRAGIFIIHVANVSTNTIRFLDIREGAGWCGEFYEVTVEKDGQTHESKGNCLYAPADVPVVVELAPGNTYDREIQPVAYVRSEKHLTPPCTITVTYRLTDKIKSRWRKIATNADVDLVFQTNKAEMKASSRSGVSSQMRARIVTVAAQEILCRRRVHERRFPRADAGTPAEGPGQADSTVRGPRVACDGPRGPFRGRAAPTAPRASRPVQGVPVGVWDSRNSAFGLHEVPTGVVSQNLLGWRTGSGDGQVR